MNQILVKSYKDLKFWQKSKEVSVDVIKLTHRIPEGLASKIILNQLLRCSFSVGANIAEGFGRYKGKEYSRFIQISLGSSRECEYWLELLLEANPPFSEEINSILQKNSETIKMLVATLKSLNNKG